MSKAAFDRSSTLAVTAALSSAAIVLGLLDGLLPRPLPFLKLGLANVVTVVAVMRRGVLTAVWVNATRSLMVALVMGTIATPTFALSVGGSAASALSMAAASLLAPRIISVVGVSMTGAVSSLMAQLAMASIMLPGLPVRPLVPALALWGCISGALIGLAANALLRRRVLEPLLGVAQLRGVG